MKFEFFEEKNFKQTELGPLPEDWQVVRLGEVVTKISNGITKLQNKNGKGFMVTRIETISEGKININRVGYIENLTENDIKNYKLEAGDILISHINSESQLGNCCLYNGDPPVLIHGMNLLRIKPNKNYITSEFLYFTFLEYKLKGIFISLASRAVNQASINQQKFKTIAIPLPPLEEQKAISEVLLAIQTAKEKTEAVIKAAKELKKSMMKQLFTYGVYKDTSGNWKIGNPETVEVKETEIGIIPKHWQVVRLGEMLNNNVILIKFGFPCGKWNNEKKGIAQLRPFNITEDGSIDIENIKYIQTNKDIKNYLIKKADVIFNNTNSEDLVGKTSLWDREDGVFVISNHMTIIRIKKESILNAVFLAKFLHQKWYEGFYKTICRRHVNQSSISLSRLTTIPIPLPPLEEQKAIADILQTIDEKIQKEEARKKALENLFKSMLNELMSGRLRVRIREGL